MTTATASPLLIKRHPRAWIMVTAAAVLMVLLALLGVGLTTTNRPMARTYWMVLVPVYGVLCVVTALIRGRHDPAANRYMVARQFFHWLGVAIALALTFLIQGAGEESSQAAGLNALLLLAAGCYLAGVHLELQFVVVGLFLTLIMVIVARFEQYMWLIFLIGGVLIAALGAMWWLLRPRGHKVKG